MTLGAGGGLRRAGARLRHPAGVPVLLAAAWLLSRAWLGWLLVGPHAWVGGDVAYFHDSLARLPEVGLGGTLLEYPVPAVAALGLPWLLVAALPGVPAAVPLATYAVAVAVTAVLTDLALAVALWRRARSPVAVAAWVAAVPLIGATAYARFDLLPGVLCGLAVLLAARRPATAGVLVAAAAAVKLWPVLVLPALLGLVTARRDRARAVAGFVAAGALLASAALAAAGWARLVSPLTYQVERGLQVESAAATPAMLAWAADPAAWPVGYAPSRSYEVAGPGVPLLLSLGSVLTAAFAGLLLLGWAALGVRLLRRGVPAPADRATAVWLLLATLTGYLVVGKVLSPQYLLWVLPVAAAGLAVADGRALRRWVLGLLAATLLTQLVFPVLYAGVLGDDAGRRVALASALLARNLLLAALAGVAAARAWRGLVPGQPGAALDRQPPRAAWTAGRTAR